MSVCKECNLTFKILSEKHLEKHNITRYEYIKKHYNFDILVEYETNKKSAQYIANEIKQITNRELRPIKKDILFILKKFNIKIKNTTEAMKDWNDFRGGPWNKGYTKETHESVKKYSDSRLGKNNPFFKTDPEKRIDTYFSRISKEEEILIRNRIGQTLKEMWIKGEIKHISETNPEKYKEIRKLSLIGYRKWLESPESKLTFPRSKMEIKIGDFLNELNIKNKPQRRIKGVGTFDYEILNEKIIIEYNGDYWHCNPKLYDKDFYHTTKKQYAYEIWENDKIRKEKLELKGYKVLIFWEKDFKKLTDLQIKDVLINEINKNKKSRKNKN